MDEFLKMDIFFAVTTVAVVVLSLLAAAVLISALRILRKVEQVAEMVTEEGTELRTEIQEHGLIRAVINYLFKRH